MMKEITITIIILLIGISCSKNNKCQNRFEFINCNDTIPIMEINVTEDFDSIRNDLNKLYGYDLCNNCGWTYFKLPFNIENISGFLKIMVEYDYEVCENCPPTIRDRNYFTIMFNRENEMLVEGKPILCDSLETEIFEYLSKVGKSELFPENFKKVNYQIRWDNNCNRDMLNKILKIIYCSQLKFITNELNNYGKDFCSLRKKELKELKIQYPLRIFFDLRKVRIEEELDIEGMENCVEQLPPYEDDIREEI